MEQKPPKMNDLKTVKSKKNVGLGFRETTPMQRTIAFRILILNHFDD